LKKVCYKVSLCENCQRQSSKAFIGLTISAKLIGGRRPLVPEVLSQSDRVGAKFEQAAITPKRYEIGCQLLLITNRKQHTGFRLVPTSMILNDLERRNSFNFAFFTEFDRFSGRLYHSTYNVRKILFPSSSLLLLGKTITHPTARSLCDS